MASKAVPSVVSTSLIVVSAVFPALSLLGVVLRWSARRKVKSGWQIDDWVIVVTWFITFGISIDIWALTPHIGINFAKQPITSSTISSAKCVWSTTLLMNVALAVVKISVLLFYKRIFVTPRFAIVCWIAIALVGSWGIITTILHVVQSNPISSNWNGFGTFRFDPAAFSKARAGSSFALDIVILLLPIEKIVHLHMSPRKKMTVALIFAMGGFCCIAAAVRLALVVQTIDDGAATKTAGYTRICKFMLLSYFKLARTSRTVLWGVIEPNCSIIAACLPCYGPVFRGRAPESIIRSVRSVLSLASLGSNHSRNSQRSNRSKIYNQGLGNQSVPPKSNAKEATESEIELRDLGDLGRTDERPSRSLEDWEESGNEAHVEHTDRIA
ncbi:hypothetical protein DM02DRAFT_597681 [Periconia macrospinosa]|uniref:Rhodopsin domain-containing protein n=1 Tax=Periconia macrospinosa TaxID=97972 RepID=A0A2V1DGY8_9PLEO|nr:hypothetical protein DM02DRAFT_597681 [Periconia macrospinosa]